MEKIVIISVLVVLNIFMGFLYYALGRSSMAKEILNKAITPALDEIKKSDNQEAKIFEAKLKGFSAVTERIYEIIRPL